jgi:hypothetical protein
MKILHCCLSCFYIDNYNYQENILPRQNKADGHEVLIIASTEIFINNSELGYTNPSRYVTEYGVPIIRVPYQKIFAHYISTKIRKYIGVYKLIEEFNPDVILFHGCCAFELLTIARYIKKHSNVKLYVDSHEDFNNSARGFVSKNILHKLFYKNILRRSLQSISKVFYITYETKLFLLRELMLPTETLPIKNLRCKVAEKLWSRNGDFLVVSQLLEKREEIAFISSVF